MWDTVHNQNLNNLCCFLRYAPFFFTFKTLEDKHSNDCNQWKNRLLCFIVVDKFPSRISSTEERGDGRNVEGRAVTTVESLCWCGGKTTDREALYNRRYQTEEKLYAQEQECAGSNERGKVLWPHACVRCHGRGYKSYLTLSCAAKNISWCVYKKECADWRTLHWKREPTGQQI